MNCEYVAQLLPLYVGRDLEEERSASVAAHLRSCLPCVRAADEYTRASQLLQRLEPPFFSDEVYAGIRREVLNQIEQQSQTPAWPNVVRQLFPPLVRPRMAWITAGIILAISVSAFYFIANRSKELSNDKPIAGGTLTRTGNGSNSSSSTAGGSLASTGSAAADKKGINARRPLVQRNKGIIDTARRGILTSRATAPKRSVSPNERLLQPGVDFSQPASAAAPLRIEIQTNDRNIRIIWLGNTRSQSGVIETTKGI